VVLYVDQAHLVSAFENMSSKAGDAAGLCIDNFDLFLSGKGQ
jgi:hypothetical protein